MVTSTVGPGVQVRGLTCTWKREEVKMVWTEASNPEWPLNNTQINSTMRPGIIPCEKLLG
jgi:hypothetical protein